MCHGLSVTNLLGCQDASSQQSSGNVPKTWYRTLAAVSKHLAAVATLSYEKVWKDVFGKKCWVPEVSQWQTHPAFCQKANYLQGHLCDDSSGLVRKLDELYHNLWGLQETC